MNLKTVLLPNLDLTTASASQPGLADANSTETKNKRKSTRQAATFIPELAERIRAAAKMRNGFEPDPNLVTEQQTQTRFDLD